MTLQDFKNTYVDCPESIIMNALYADGYRIFQYLFINYEKFRDFAIKEGLHETNNNRLYTEDGLIFANWNNPKNTKTIPSFIIQYHLAETLKSDAISFLNNSDNKVKYIRLLPKKEVVSCSLEEDMKIDDFFGDL